MRSGCNEIYEGDGLILIRAKQDGDALTLEGWEDLNGDNTIDDAQDDQLFSIVKDTNDGYEMRGYHSNGYYNSHWGPGDFLFTYLLISAVTPRFGYYYSRQLPAGQCSRTANHLPKLVGLQQPKPAQRDLQPEAVDLRWFPVPAVSE